MSFETLIATDRAEWSDNDDTTYSASGTGAEGTLSTYVSGQPPMAIMVSYRALSFGPAPSTISGVYLNRAGEDLASSSASVTLPHDGVARNYASSLGFLAPVADILDSLSTVNMTILGFLFSGYQNVNITEMSVRVDYGLSGGIYPLRRYPPVNNGGFGPTRHVPKTVARHAGWSY